jgi:two-component system cell cycle response regulator
MYLRPRSVAAMIEARLFQIALYGFSVNERNALTSLFSLTSSRPRQYKVIAANSPSKADIALVDADNQDALTHWQAVSHNAMPALLVSQTPLPNSDVQYYLKRPFSKSRLLDTLDEITIRILRYVPELVVANRQGNDEDIPQALKTASLAAQSVAVNHHKVLVVDDSPSVRKMMEVELRLQGIVPDMAESGEQGLRLCTQHIYDAIFLDLVLPGIDGYKVCRILRRQPQYKKTPVIMLTGKDGTFDKLRGTMVGCSMYLTKPVAQKDLYEALQKFLPATYAAASYL